MVFFSILNTWSFVTNINAPFNSFDILYDVNYKPKSIQSAYQQNPLSNLK